MFRVVSKRTFVQASSVLRRPVLPNPAYGQIRSYARDMGNDKGPKVQHFFVVALLGTVFFGLVVNKIEGQDPAKSLAKRKNSFSEQEWEQQLEQIKRKKLLFEDTENFYVVPFGAHKEQQVESLTQKLGDNTAVVDLNQLIQQQLNDSSSSKYGTLLAQTMDSCNRDSNTCFFTFSYKLAPGIFTKLVSDEVLRIKQENPATTNFVLLNYPNNIKEAVKFEQDVAITKNLVLLDEEDNDSGLVDYFKTVDKVVSVKDL